MSFENVPSSGLALHNTADAHRPAQDNHRKYRNTQRQLIADNHGTAADGTDNRVLAVTTPSGQQNTDHPDTRSGQHEEYSYLHIQNLCSLVPGQARKRDDGSQNHQIRRQFIKHMVGLPEAYDFLGQYLQHVGRHLQQSAFASHTVRSDTALESTANTAFHVNEHHGQHSVCQQNDYAQRQPFDKNSPVLRHHTYGVSTA